MNDKQMILLFLPVILIQLVLVITALVDLKRRRKVRFGNKLVWVIIILGVSMLGPIIYFTARGDDE